MAQVLGFNGHTNPLAAFDAAATLGPEVFEPLRRVDGINLRGPLPVGVDDGGGAD